MRIGKKHSALSDMARSAFVPFSACAFIKLILLTFPKKTVHALYSPGGGAVEAVRQLFPGAIVDGGE